jgi:hypothetical protein
MPMTQQRVVKVICFLITFLIAIDLFIAGSVHASEFEIDEIITAIKNEIRTANIPELGSPKFTIDTVKVSLTVVSTETEKGALSVKIFGFSDEFENSLSTFNSRHNLSFSFKPADSSGISPEISLGLVEPIKKVKSSLRKACNTPPSLQMEGFTFKLEFAIQQHRDGGIRFRILELEDLKAQNIATHYISLHIKISN